MWLAGALCPKLDSVWYQYAILVAVGKHYTAQTWSWDSDSGDRSWSWKQGRIEDPRPPDISWVDDWNLG